MRSAFRIAALALAASLSIPAQGLLAAQPPSTRPAASEAAMSIEIDKGELIRLPQPAASVVVANPDIADIQVMSPTLVYVFGRAAGETALFAVDGSDRVLANRRIVVRHNLSALNRAIAEHLPKARIQAGSVAGSIVLTGTAATLDEVETARRLAARYVPAETDVINRVDIEGPTQIHLRVRVAEVSRTVGKQFGLNWEAIGESGNFRIGFARGRDIVSDGGTFPRAEGLDSLVASLATGRVNLNILLDALENEGLVKILAEPNLTALSGQPASFLAGGEFPIPVPGEDSTITVQFKEFGIRLEFLPQLVGESRINLRVRPEVSQLSSAGAIRIGSLEIPALTTRRAETTVELASGQSFAVAGLLQNNANQSVSKFPLLGDVPVLGALFRSQSFQRDETELVIVVTPILVRPTDAARIALPTDGLKSPDDIERLAFGRTVDRGSARAIRPVSAGGPGFILD